MKVSVIIPTYNGERHVAQTLAAVLAQTHPDVELIVVDDGSTDGTLDVVATAAPSARVLCKTNGGVSSARNLGIRSATGEALCLLDQDDLWRPDKLAGDVRCLQQHTEADVVFSDFERWLPDADGTHRVPQPWLELPGSAECAQPEPDPEFSGWIYHQFLLDCWMLTSTATFRRRAFDLAGIFDESLPYSEDWDLWLRMARTVRFLKRQETTTLYRQHASQGSRLTREVDYRTELLHRAAARWGLCSQDGRCVARRQFLKQLSRYHTEFALGHIIACNLHVADRAVLKALRCNPLNWRAAAYAAVARLGWRPSWADQL